MVQNSRRRDLGDAGQIKQQVNLGRGEPLLLVVALTVRPDWVDVTEEVGQ